MKLTRTNKILLTLGSVGVAATIAGAGTFAAFTDTETATQKVTGGTVNLVAGATSFATDIDALAPGDTVQKAFTLTNSGTLAFKKVDVAVATPATDELFTGVDSTGTADPAQALKVKVERCTVPWTVSGGLLTCTGTATTITSETTAKGLSDSWDSTKVATAVNGVSYLLATYRLPAGAGNLAQGDTGTLTWTLTATQRDAVNS